MEANIAQQGSLTDDIVYIESRRPVAVSDEETDSALDLDQMGYELYDNFSDFRHLRYQEINLGTPQDLHLKQPTAVAMRSNEEMVEWEILHDGGIIQHESPKFNLRNGSISIQLMIDGQSEDKLIINVIVDRKESDNELIRFLLPPTITFQIKNASNNLGIRKDFFHECDLPFGSALIGSIYKYELTQEGLKQAVKNGKIPVALYLNKMGSCSTKGVLRWSMSSYGVNSALFKTGFITGVKSPPFYTSVRGYRVKVAMILGEEVSALIQFVAGEFDHELPKSFCHLTTVSIFSKWDCLSSHIQKSTTHDLAKAWCYEIRLATQQELAEKGMLVDDTLHLLINISEISFEKRHHRK